MGEGEEEDQERGRERTWGEGEAIYAEDGEEECMCADEDEAGDGEEEEDEDEDACEWTIAGLESSTSSRILEPLAFNFDFVAEREEHAGSRHMSISFPSMTRPCFSRR